MFAKIANNIGRIPTHYLLLIILFIGFILRTFSWFYFGTFLMEDDPHRMLTHGGVLYISDYEYFAMHIAEGNFGEWFDGFDGREYQPIYPLLLAPRHFLDLPQEAYIFCLHHLLSIGTIYIVYLTAKRIFGVYYGLVSAFFISISAMMIFWFSWVYAETTFHFFLALLGLTATNLFKDKKPINYTFFFFSGFLCMLTRPEGFFPFLIAFLLLIFIHLTQKLTTRKALFIIAGGIFFLSSLFVSTLVLHKKTQEFFFSQVHVAYPLFVSSKISSGSAVEQNRVYTVDKKEVWKKGRERPDFVSDNYSMSMYGLNFIKEHPFTWIKMYGPRFVANIFPSIYTPQWSTGHRIYNFSMAFILVIGSIMALFFGDSRPAGRKYVDSQHFLTLSLFLMVFILAFSISLFQREMDYRVPLSMFILFAMLAPYGWFKFYTYLSKRYAHK